MFIRFEKEGLRNKELGRKYRKIILEPGNSEEALDLVSRFLGRELDGNAFLRSIGLKK